MYFNFFSSVKPLMRTTCPGIGPPGRTVCRYRFSAFWLRSSVVSVLISLISDTSPTRGPYIKLIFGTWSWKRGLLRPLHASTWYCSTSRNGAPPLNVKINQTILSRKDFPNSNFNGVFSIFCRLSNVKRLGSVSCST